MSLQKLDVLAVRNIQQETLQPSPGLNFITGPNASGKSSLLEAIYILGRGRSFRTPHIRQAISFEQSHLIVAAQQKTQTGHQIQLGIKIDSKKHESRINQETVSKADLAYHFPVQLLHPKSYQLLDGGPQFRREFMDWGVFNQDKSFLEIWKKYKRALQQRNALLKTKNLRQLDTWSAELVQYGEKLALLRKNYMLQLESFFQQLKSYFLNDDKIQLDFTSGWNVQFSLGEALELDLDKDIRYGFTHSGPHRSDFSLLLHQRHVRDYVSRGQLMLFVISLVLSQVHLMNESNHNPVCILIDDLTAELDSDNRSKLVKYLADMQCQVFLTSNDLSGFEPLPDSKMFHVEHGKFKTR